MSLDDTSNPARDDLPAPPIGLSEGSGAEPVVDGNPRMLEPPPVRLVTVQDARLPAGAGMEVMLDAFYVALLSFERDAHAEMPVYRAANFSLVFEICEPPVIRHDMRAIGIEVQSLGAIERQLIDQEIEYVLQRGLLPGDVSMLLQDPAGNWLELTEAAIVR
jgi:hypothetical protein